MISMEKNVWKQKDKITVIVFLWRPPLNQQGKGGFAQKLFYSFLSFLCKKAKEVKENFFFWGGGQQQKEKWTNEYETKGTELI